VAVSRKKLTAECHSFSSEVLKKDVGNFVPKLRGKLKDQNEMIIRILELGIIWDLVLCHL
jgi:hypothetical protein